MRIIKKGAGISLFLLCITGMGITAEAKAVVHDYNDEPFPTDGADSSVVEVDGHEFVYEVMERSSSEVEGLKVDNYGEAASGYGNSAVFRNSTGDALSIRRKDGETFQFISLEAGMVNSHSFYIRGYKDGDIVEGAEVEITKVDGFENYAFPEPVEVDEIKLEHDHSDTNTLIFDNFTFDPMTNEPPVITSAGTVSVEENETDVTTVEAEDPDGGDVTYGVSGTDASHFDINPETGELTFRNPPDFEEPADENKDNTFEAVVTADDGEHTAQKDIMIEMLNVNDNVPVIKSGADVSLAEGDTDVTTVTAEDDDGDTLSYGLDGGEDVSYFEIKEDTGELTLTENLDFEAPVDENNDNKYEVIVSALDGRYKATQDLTVTITDENEAPEITSEDAVTVMENKADVTTVEAEDPEGDTLAYSITGGSDDAMFRMDASTGALQFKNTPDYERPEDSDAGNDYEVDVQVDDGDMAVEQSIMVEVENINDNAPEITSDDSVLSPEDTSKVMTVTAEDVDGGALGYEVTGGADASYFEMDTITGELRFNEAPDFEEPADENGDNEYQVEVKADDGELQTTQQITVLVTNKNDHPPVVAEETFQINDDVTNGTVIGTVDASDADGDDVHYKIASGSNGDVFSIDKSTGSLTLLDTDALESGSSYTLTVEADDGKHQTQADITIQTETGNIYLKQLEISTGALSFEPETTNYSLQLAGDVTEVKVTPYAAADNETISVNGNIVTSGQKSGGIPLDAGENTITIDVSGKNGAKTTYKLSVTRADSENEDEDESNDGSSGGSGGSSGSGTDSDSEGESEDVGPEGGSVEMDGISLSLPENAVSRDEEITVERVTEDLPEEQQPEGQIIMSDVFQLKKESEAPFDKPVTISVPYDKDKVHPLQQKVSLYGRNEEKEWMELDDIVIQIEDGVVTGKTNEAVTVAVQASAPGERYMDEWRLSALRFLSMIQ
ncbi:cadherin domain-containing protein [Salibacterium lacus]|uniref:Cadherin domain-containing protein n=1 Tax=Salibacterium lacus TaxID=1898109 RepID=A0ABW5T4M5_9BACI